MSQKKKQQAAPKAAVNKTVPSPVPTANEPKAFAIPFAWAWLGIATLLMYVPSFFLKFTELDDSIFIHDFAAYNEDPGSLIESFKRGVFGPLDPYYRPLFLDSMVINSRININGQEILGYHIVNVLFHIICVLLIYRLFVKLGIKDLTAFILSLVFAVHPVLSQAVAWIPGRNDTMLGIFSLSFFIFCVDYVKSSKTRFLILSGFFLLLAYFTKETAAFAAPAAFILIVFVLQKKWNERNNIIQYGVWIACFLVWFIARANATVQPGTTFGQVLTGAVHHLPVLLQYAGKIFLPFNLSVFPIQQDTVNYYGIAAIVLLAALLFLNKERNMRMILAGLGIFLLFLVPALLIPDDLNQQTFEHRLYLPMIGILLVLPQTILFKNALKPKELLAGGVLVCGLLAFINYNHQQKFADPLTFWTSAEATSPHSAYAVMMLAAREPDTKVSDTLFRRAYKLNPKEKYLNFYMAEMLQKEDSVAQSEKYLLAEKSISNFYKVDFMLARVAMERKDYAAAITDLENAQKREPGNTMAKNNLLLLYLQTNQRDKAIGEAKLMQQTGVAVPPQIRAQLGITNP